MHESEKTFDDPQGPAFRIIRREIVHNSPTIIGIIDDNYDIVRGLQRYLEREMNLKAVGFHFNEKKILGDFSLRVVAQSIIDHGVNVAVCDKGLGFTSGIDLILALKAIGCPTIMLTGEADTRETHRVADIYLEKPIVYENLIASIRSLSGV